MCTKPSVTPVVASALVNDGPASAGPVIAVITSPNAPIAAAVDLTIILIPPEGRLLDTQMVFDRPRALNGS